MPLTIKPATLKFWDEDGTELMRDSGMEERAEEYIQKVESKAAESLSSLPDDYSTAVGQLEVIRETYNKLADMVYTGEIETNQDYLHKHQPHMSSLNTAEDALLEHLEVDYMPEQATEPVGERTVIEVHQVTGNFVDIKELIPGVVETSPGEFTFPTSFTSDPMIYVAGSNYLNYMFGDNDKLKVTIKCDAPSHESTESEESFEIRFYYGLNGLWYSYYPFGVDAGLTKVFDNVYAIKIAYTEDCPLAVLKKPVILIGDHSSENLVYSPYNKQTHRCVLPNVQEPVGSVDFITGEIKDKEGVWQYSSADTSLRIYYHRIFKAFILQGSSFSRYGKLYVKNSITIRGRLELDWCNKYEIDRFLEKQFDSRPPRDRRIGVCNTGNIMVDATNVSAPFIIIRDDRYTSVEEFKAQLDEWADSGAPLTLRCDNQFSTKVINKTATSIPITTKKGVNVFYTDDYMPIKITYRTGVNKLKRIIYVDDEGYLCLNGGNDE